MKWSNLACCCLCASRTSANSIERIASSVVGTVSFFLRRKRIRVDYIAESGERDVLSCGPASMLYVCKRRGHFCLNRLPTARIWRRSWFEPPFAACTLHVHYERTHRDQAFDSDYRAVFDGADR